MLNNIILIFLLKNIIFKKYFIDLFSNNKLLLWARHFVPQKLKLNYYKDKGPVYLKSDLIGNNQGYINKKYIFGPYTSPFNEHISWF